MVAAATSPAYGPRPIRARRTAHDIQNIRDALDEILTEQHPATCRGVFYQAVSRGAIKKTETEYKSTIIRLLGEMRRAGDLPFDWIADNTRWMRKPRTYSSVEEAIESTAEFYRRAVWDSQDVYVEVWLEKDALSGVLYPITSTYDVPLMVTRGYPSLTFLHSAAEAIAEQDVPAYIYYLGDHDPSGLDITRAVEQGLREFAPDAEIRFERIAVTPRQIAGLSLPTRPTKTTDSRARNFTGESVEVDAIPPNVLRNLVEQRITQHIDPHKWNALMVAEESERKILINLSKRHVRKGGAR